MPLLRCAHRSSELLGGVAGLLLVLSVTQTTVDAQQVISLNIGKFVVNAADARPPTDILVTNASFLTFDLGGFDNVTFGGDWLLALGDFLEGGVGAELYQQTVPSVYDKFFDTDGSEIAQDLKLTTVSLLAILRYFPVTRDAPIQPYLGGGIGATRWRYSESGQFLNFDDFSTVNGTFADQGTALGPMLLAGVRIPFGWWLHAGAEVRYRIAEATLDPSLNFSGTTLDLGGLTTLATVQFRFPY